MKKALFIFAFGLTFLGNAEEITTNVELNGESVNYSSLSGSGTISNSSLDSMSVVTVDCASDCVFEGTITGNIRLVKKGSGILTIAGENTQYTGGTYVEGGVLAARSLNHLGKQGSSTNMSSVVFVKNGATVRIGSGAAADSPVWMNQGICVPEGDTGVLELDGWISHSGTLMMKNATLRLLGGGMKLGSWLDNFVPGATFDISNSTLSIATGAALAGTVKDFTLVLREGGVLQMPPVGEELPNLVLAGGTIERSNLGGGMVGDIISGAAATPICDFRLYGSLRVEPSENPSVIDASVVAFGRPGEKIYGISVAEGAQLVVRGVLKPAAEDSGVYLSKRGEGILRLDGHCATKRFVVEEGKVGYTLRTSFADGCVFDAANGVSLLLEDGVEANMPMSLDNGLLASADVWLDATKVVAKNEETVASIPNRGSLGGNFYKASNTDAPTFAVSAIGGKNALAFNGSQVLLYDGYTNKTSSLTTFVVMMPTAHVKWSSPFSLCTVAPGNSGDESSVSGTYFYSFNNDAVSIFKAGRGPVNSDGWAFEYSLPSYSLSMSLLLHHQRNGTSGTTKAYYGSEYAPFTQTCTWGWKDQNIERLCVGGRLYANGEPTAYRHMKGYIGELIVFTRVLSDSEYNYIETYLRNKWFGEKGALERIAYPGAPRVNVEVEEGSRAIFSASSASGEVGGTLVKTGNGTLVPGDMSAVAKLEVGEGEVALTSVSIAGKAAIWIDPDDESTVTISEGSISAIANKGFLGGNFEKNLGAGATLLSGEYGINGKNVLSFDKNGTLLYTGFVREDATKARSLNVYAVVSRRSFAKFSSPFSFAHTDDGWFDKDADANFHYEEHDAGGGCYRTFYGKDARGFTNWTMTAGTYFVDLPRRDADGEAYLSVNRMGSDWQLTATVLESDELDSAPWYSTSGCRLSPLHVNRISLGAAMTQGGSGAGAGGYWDGRIGEFIVFEEPLSVAEETELLKYLRKKWFGKGDGSELPPSCLAGSVKTSSTHDRFLLDAGPEAVLRHTLSDMPLASLFIDSASVVRAPVDGETAKTKLFSIADDFVAMGVPSFEMGVLRDASVTLFSVGGTISGNAKWSLTEELSARFTYEVDIPGGICRLRKRHGMAIVLR